MDIERLTQFVLSLPEVADWPEMAALFKKAAQKPRPDWDLPTLSCQAVGGAPGDALPGVAAITLLYLSILLVDDILDDDPRGEYHRLGMGPTANLAIGYQAAALRLIELAGLSAERCNEINRSLAWMAHATALGQQLDLHGPEDEDGYWKIVKAKSTPFYATALHVGALLGGADTETADRLRAFGALVGEIVQLHDDLFDVMQSPATPDWDEKARNLLMLYALNADYPERDRFRKLLPRVADSSILQEAQTILIRCGAVSYCVYHLLERQRQARQILDRIQLANRSPMDELMQRQIRPVQNILKNSGVEITSFALPE